MLRNPVSRRTSILIFLSFLVAAITVVLTPKRVLADEGRHFKGTFTVAFSALPNTEGRSFCGGMPLALIVEAHGAGSSTLGPLSVSIDKTVTGPDYHGCLTLTDPNGDSLSAIYDATQGLPNANNFRHATGTLTFTGGTGRFEGAGGTADFTADFSRIGATANPVQGMAFYSVNGTLLLQHDDR